MQEGQKCPFCQLIDNPEQLKLVGETENFYAWLEVNPRARGHTMIVPKEHTENLLDLETGGWQEAMELTREVVEKAKKGLGADGVSVTMNIEEAGGQMLPHAYIIVFPRFQDEENAGTPTGAIFPQREELQSELGEIKDSMTSVSVDFGQETREAHPESKKHLEERNHVKSPVEEAALKTKEAGKQEQREKEPEKEEEQVEETEVEKKEEKEVEFTGKSFEYR